MHIAIEGIDGVGKSTIARILEKELNKRNLNFTLVEKPLHLLFDENGKEENYLRIRNVVNLSTNKKYTAWFYGLGNIFLYEHFKGQNIITDRHILSNYCWSGADETDYIFNAIFETTKAPSFTFLLYANEEALKQRLKKRNEKDSDLHKVQYLEKAYERMQSLLIRYNMPHYFIDSSNIEVENLAQIMLEKLHEEGVIHG